MNLTEKEIKYINAIIEADGDIDLDFVLNMINKKRSPADAVDIDDVLTVIERLSSTPNGIEGNTESSVVSESTTIGKNLKRLSK